MRRALIVALGVAALTAAGARAAPTPITLTFDGVHVADNSLPGGIRHQGRFTASAPLCGAGSAVDVQDVEVEPLTVMRRYTCDDGSGTFTAFLPAIAAEHGGSGSWKIVGGTGAYASLRGIGSYSGRLVSGDPTNFLSIVFQTAWQGVVDFDTSAPSFSTHAVSTKIRRPSRTYSVKTTIDGGEPNFRYTVDIRAGSSELAFRRGDSASVRVAVTTRVRVPRGTRRVRVTVTVDDAVGNESMKTLTLPLKRGGP